MEAEFARELERELLESAERIARLEGERDEAARDVERYKFWRAAQIANDDCEAINELQKHMRKWTEAEWDSILDAALASSQGTLTDNAQAKCTNSAPSNTEGTGDNAKEREER